MKAFAVTDKGMEPVLKLEVKELAGAEAKVFDSCAVFDAPEDALFKFTYMTQSSDRVAIHLADFEFSDFSDLIDKAGEAVSAESLKEWLNESTTFKVYCDRRGEHDFNSTVAEQEIGGVVIEKCNEDLDFEPKVELKQADVIFYLFIRDSKAYLGVDLAGRELSKRQYRIFTNPGIINAKLAYALARIAKYDPKKAMVDLHCGAGIIPIEIALWKSRTSISFYNKDFSMRKLPRYSNKDWDAFFQKIDKERLQNLLGITGFDPLLRNVEASKKNAKLAGVDKLMRFSKLDLEWMDIKLDDSEIDVVISRIPTTTSHFPEKAATKYYNELFHQAEFFLKEKGRLCVLSENLFLFRQLVTKYFKIVEEHHLWSGGQEYEFLILERARKSS